MNELSAILFSWAVTLSGYHHDASKPVPPVIEVSHQWLVDNACGGRECKVLGWYDGGEHIYVDERLAWRDTSSGAAASIVVHEYVHYLQKQVGTHGTTYQCNEAIALEREAYLVQKMYLYQNGINYMPGSVVHSMTCEDEEPVVKE